MGLSSNEASISISQSRYSAVYGGGHAKTVFLHAAISAAAHQICEMLMNVQFRFCRDERSELCTLPNELLQLNLVLECTAVHSSVVSFGMRTRRVPTF